MRPINKPWTTLIGILKVIFLLTEITSSILARAAESELIFTINENRGFLTSSYTVLQDAKPVFHISRTYHLGRIRLQIHELMDSGIHENFFYIKEKFSELGGKIFLQDERKNNLIFWLTQNDLEAPQNDSGLPRIALLDRNETVLLATNEKKQPASDQNYVFYNRHQELVAQLVRSSQSQSQYGKQSFELSLNSHRIPSGQKQQVLAALIAFALVKLSNEAWCVRKQALVTAGKVTVAIGAVLLLYKNRQKAHQLLQRTRRALRPPRSNAGLTEAELNLFTSHPYLEDLYRDGPGSDIMSTQDFRILINEQLFYHPTIVNFIARRDALSDLRSLPMDSRTNYIITNMERLLENPQADLIRPVVP